MMEEHDLSDFKKRLAALELILIEQEHRPFTVLKRFFIDRRKWRNDDPRRAAAIKAVIWSIFFSPISFAIGGSIVGILSIGVLVWQNLIIQDQILRQDRLAVEQRRSNALRLIYEDQYAKTPQIRSQALRELAIISFETREEKKLAVDRDFFTAAGFGKDERLGFNPGSRESDEELAESFSAVPIGVSLNRADLSNVVVVNVNLDFSVYQQTNLSGAEFAFSSLRGADFRDYSSLQKANFKYSDLTDASFERVCAKDFIIYESRISSASFRGADLREADLSRVIDWQYADYSGAIVSPQGSYPDGFVDFAKKSGAIIALPEDKLNTPCAGPPRAGCNPARQSCG